MATAPRRDIAPMSHPDATPLVMLHATTQPLGDGVPDWLHLVPAGKIETVDGRFTGHLSSAVAPRLFAIGGEAASRVPVDVNHANAKRGGAGHETPAIGWIVELQVRGDGLWGRAEWNTRGKTALAEKEYRGVSPEVIVRKSDGVILGIQGASLTNVPNLRGLVPLLNTQEQDNMDELLKKLRAALGLGADVGEDVVLNSIGTLKTSAATMTGQLAALAKAAGAAETASHEVVLNAIATRSGGDQVIAALQEDLKKVTVELNTVRDTAAREKAETYVDGQIRMGRVGIKPNKAHFVALHMANPAEAQKVIEAFPVLTGEMTAPAAAAKDGEVVLNSAELAVARQLGLSDEAMIKVKAAEAEGEVMQ